MSVLSAINHLYKVNQERAFGINRRNRFIISVYNGALSEKKLYNGTKFMDLLSRLMKYNSMRSIYFPAKHPFITALYNECKSINAAPEANKSKEEANKPKDVANKPKEVKKAALLIGINYKGTKSQLNGSENSVYEMKEILKSKYGFKDENILVLTESEKDKNRHPTYQNIMSALAWLVKMGNNGYSKLWFQYSGHGFYVKDTNGDEADGLDECLVTNDNYAIIDDHLRQSLINKLPKECQLFCFMDCCHSGTMLDLKYEYKAKSNEIVKVNHSESKCDIISISGCRDDQVGWEAKFYNKHAGALTWTFLNTIKSYKYKEVGLFELIKKVHAAIKKVGFDQVPQLTSSYSLTKDSRFSI
jgi:hypothetical protein